MQHLHRPSTFTNGDDRLVSAIEAAIQKSGLKIPEKVNISVVDGIVTLKGKTDSFYQRQLLVHAAHRVPGVLGLVDEVVVKPR